MGTDKNQAGRCLGKPSCASEPDSLASKLADSPVSESLLAPRAALVFSRSARDIGNGKEKDTGLRLACQGGGVLEKHLKARLRVSFSKQFQHSCNESTLGFQRGQIG